MKNTPPLIVEYAGAAPLDAEAVHCPLVASGVAAGFPSPAEDYVEQMLDLNKYCIRNAPATFYVRVREDGYSMVDAGIYPGDLLCVDRSLTAQHGDVVVAVVDGEFTLKELIMGGEKPVLRPHNAAYADITCDDFAELEIFGVVTAVIRKFKRGKSVRTY